MSNDLSSVLHGFADDQSRAAAAELGDPAVRARTVAALVRRRRSRHLTGAVAAAAALVVAGTVVANALTPQPEPQPAEPVPSATTTPAPTSSPAPTATSTATDAARPVVPERTAPWVRGFVADLTVGPSELWTVRASDTVPGWSEDLPPGFGHVALRSLQPGIQLVDAGETLVALVADPYLSGAELVGLDAGTGEVRWTRGSDEPRPTRSCAGTSPDGLVVCLGTSEAEGPSEIQLLDPATGEVVRAYPTGFTPDGLGVSGSTAVLHGSANEAMTDVRRDGVDLTSGEVLWSNVAVGRGEPYVIQGEPVADTLVSWPWVRLDGYFSRVVVDVRTGEEVVRPVDPTFDADLNVWAPTDPEAAPVLDPWAHDASGATLLGERAALRALDPRDGSVRWSMESAGAMPRAVVGDVLVVTDEAETSALDLATGELLWTGPQAYDVVATDGTRILLSNGAVLLLEDGSVVSPATSSRWLAPLLGPSGRFMQLGEDGVTFFGW